MTEPNQAYTTQSRTEPPILQAYPTSVDRVPGSSRKILRPPKFKQKMLATQKDYAD